jgi:hypothetical protein
LAWLALACVVPARRVVVERLVGEAFAEAAFFAAFARALGAADEVLGAVGILELSPVSLAGCEEWLVFGELTAVSAVEHLFVPRFWEIVTARS